MYKVFYHPDTLEIKGHSDGAIIMDFPYIETDYQIVLFDNWKVEMKKKKPTLVVIKNQYTDEEWNAITNPK